MHTAKETKGWLGTMLDCSRNGVLKVEKVKEWIDLSVDLGYNMLMLYTEDTYELKGHPYFGYCRGRYSIAEMKEVNSYARKKGIEMIPNIQTLAHLNAITRWPAYAPHIDQKDILLVGDEIVYQLIDDMFATITECYDSEYVLVGMDEAKGLGRGKYMDIHGNCDVAEMFVSHIKRVAEIAKKYGKTICVWGDMFHSLMGPGKHENLPEDFDRTICEQIPDNVEIVCWEYDKPYVEFYDGRIKSHNRIQEGTWYAGAFRTWNGFAPHNAYTLRHINAVMTACNMNQVEHIFFGLWGDDGEECSKFAVLPSMFYASQLAKGITDEEIIHMNFKDKFGVEWDDFMLLDLPFSPNGQDEGLYNSEKYLLYNDPFMGLMDSTLDGSETEGFAQCAKRLAEVPRNDKWGYLFDTCQTLCEVLVVKAGLGQRTRTAYQTNDKEALKAVICEYELLDEKIKKFYDALCVQWHKENKAHGFEVQDMRIGGLRQRICHCKKRLEAYLSGDIAKIEELDEQLLDLMGNGECFEKKPIRFPWWKEIVSANVVTIL